MPTYLYETIPQSQNELPVRFELRQSMKDLALTKHPETDQPVRRIMLGGTGFSGLSSTAASHTHTAGGACCMGPSGCC
jgi:predicted nucleic acid-binding Zn ribbon protein